MQQSRSEKEQLEERCREHEDRVKAPSDEPSSLSMSPHISNPHAFTQPQSFPLPSPTFTSSKRMTVDLPHEVWGTIFQHCLPNEDCLVWDKHKAPWVFTRVCSSWRTIAIETPYLWTSLSIAASDDPHWRQQWDILMERSGGLPLSLELSWYPQSKDSRALEGDFPVWYQAFLSTSHRWQHLRLYLPTLKLLNLVDKPMPALETLFIGGRHLSDGFPFELHSVPRLTTVVFDGPYLDPILWVLPYEQLREIYDLVRTSPWKVCSNS